MATRNIVPRADGEGQLGKEGKRWAEVNAAKVNGSSVGQTPIAGGIPVAGDDGKLDLAWMQTSSEPAPNTVPIAGPTGKLDVGWLPSGGSSGGSSSATITIFHDMRRFVATTSEYETLCEGRFVPDLGNHAATVNAFILRSGTGRIKVSLSDGTTSVQSKGPAYVGEEIDMHILDGSSLDNTLPWTFAVAGKGGGDPAFVDRIKLCADPVNVLSCPIMAIGCGASVCGPGWLPIGSMGLVRGGAVDGSSSLIVMGRADLSAAGTASIRIKARVGEVSVASDPITISESGLFRGRCPVPESYGDMVVSIEGGTTNGVVLSVPVWQVMLAN